MQLYAREVPKSFNYSKPFFSSEDDEPPVCPHCKQPIEVGDDVHWYQDTLWHTKPCPS
ncbi:hypothetical protein [Streptomyces sp. NPDC058614]|uniref:hypothetical protein n=1 Tax=Streptomyces sp. NPDC058614 TaxID=3346557 RepID=UPI0036573BFD